MSEKNTCQQKKYICKIFVNGKQFDCADENWKALSIKLNDIALKDFVSDENEKCTEIYNR